MPDHELPSTAEPLRISLLGGFSLRFGDRSIDEASWRRPKPKAVLKLLALAPGHELHRDQVLDQLWPDLDPDAALNNLHQALHVVRRAVDPGGSTPLIQLRGEILALRPSGPLLIDVEAFETAAAEALAGRDPSAYRTAIDRYTGDLLPEDRYADWASARRDALRRLYLVLLSGLADLQDGEGDRPAAIATLQRLVATEPVHEAAHRRLMRLFAVGGDRPLALRQYRELEAALRRELDAEPDAASRRLRAEIAAGGDLGDAAARSPGAGPPPRAPAAGASSERRARTNLPAPATSFIGRDRHRAEVMRLIETARLVTLTGPGGVGKTRLALQVAAEVAPDFADGVWLVELAAIADPLLVPPTVAAAAGVREVPGRPPLESLLRELRQRRLLLILDNCEHLIDACADLADRLVRAAPGVRLLTTSREPLRVPGEVTWPVPSLSLPDPGRSADAAGVLQAEAVRLLVERVRAVRPDFALATDDLPAAVQLCHRLDGLPLAIELAAARARALPLAEIVARLDHRFRILTGGSRTAPTRQQTLKAALDWSYELLDARERTLLARLSVFAGGFGLVAAEAVCGWDEGDEDVLDLLSRLVDKSLVIAEPRAGEGRYRLLETIRQYAADRLAEHGEGAALRARHAAYYLDLAESAAPELKGGGQQHWLPRLRAELDNLRAALEWSLSGEGDPTIALRLVSALGWFWQIDGHHSEGRAWFDAALDRAGAEQAPARLPALVRAGLAEVLHGELEAGLRRLAAGEALARDLGDRRELAGALVGQVWPILFRGDHPAARSAAEQALATFRDLGDRWETAFALMARGFVAVESGELAAADAYFGEALALYRALADGWGVGTALIELARIAYRRGDAARARAGIEEALATTSVAGDKWLKVQALGLAVEISRVLGDLDGAAALAEEGLVLSEDIGQRSHVAWALRSLGFIACARGDLATAAARLLDGLATFRAQGYRLGIGCCLTGLGVVAVAHRQPDVGARLFGAADALLAALGAELAPADRLDVERALTGARAILPAPAFATAWAAGRTLTVDQAAAEAADLASP